MARISPSSEATGSSSTLRRAMELARRRSIDPSVLQARLEAPELTPELLRRSYPLPMQRFGKLMDEVAGYLGCRSYGALLGEMIVPLDYDPLHRVFFSGPDLISGLVSVNNALHRVGSTQTTVIRRVSSGVLLGASDSVRGVDLPLQVLEFRLSALMSFVRAWLGDEWMPKSVDVSLGDRGSAATFERISNGASMNFNSKMTGFVIPIELAHRAACGAQTTLRFRAQHACAVALEHGCLNEKTVSSFLGLSSRSLHRKLRVEGTTLRQLYDELRRERAVLYLTQTQLPIAEVARYLGYDLQRNFTRAFRRWEGCSPREARSRSRLGGMLSE